MACVAHKTTLPVKRCTFQYVKRLGNRGSRCGFIFAGQARDGDLSGMPRMPVPPIAVNQDRNESGVPHHTCGAKALAGAGIVQCKLSRDCTTSKFLRRRRTAPLPVIRNRAGASVSPLLPPRVAAIASLTPLTRFAQALGHPPLGVADGRGVETFAFAYFVVRMDAIYNYIFAFFRLLHSASLSSAQKGTEVSPVPALHLRCILAPAQQGKGLDPSLSHFVSFCSLPWPQLQG